MKPGEVCGCMNQQLHAGSHLAHFGTVCIARPNLTGADMVSSVIMAPPHAEKWDILSEFKGHN